MNQSYCDCRGGISNSAPTPLIPDPAPQKPYQGSAPRPPCPGAAQAHAYRIFNTWSPDLPVISLLPSGESPRSALVCFALIIKSGFINAV